MRLLLSHKGVKYNDYRIELKDWASMKSQLNGFSLPVLEFPDGRMFNQGQTIMRYLATKYGYYPKDIAMQYDHDRICDDFYDIFGKVSAPALMKGPEQDAACQEAITCFRKFFKTIETRLQRGPFLFGNQLTAADFWVGAIYVNYACNDMAYGRAEWAQLLKDCPVFERFGKAFVAANSKHLSTRPMAPF